MAQQKGKSDNGIQTVNTFADGLARDFEILSENNNSAASRLVWFVAIAGFALLNIGGLANSIAGTTLAPLQSVFLVLPWALAGFSGIVAHWLNGEVQLKDKVFHILKQHSIRAWLANASRQPSIPDVLRILNVDTTDTEVAQRKRDVDRLSPKAQWWENATFAFLVFSFIWSVIYPLIILLTTSPTKP